MCAGYYVAEQSNQFSNYTSISTSGIDFEIAEMEIQQKTAKKTLIFSFQSLRFTVRPWLMFFVTFVNAKPHKKW